MPKLGESITEGTIISWSVQVGDMVQEDDVLFEVNTAKVSAEIPSPVAGKVIEILFKEGDTVAVGAVVAIIDQNGGEKEEVKGDQGVEGDRGDVSEKEESKEVENKEESKINKEPEKGNNSEEERWYSPVVLQLAREAKITREELDKIPGTGYEGRLSKRDIRKYIEEREEGKTLTSGQGEEEQGKKSTSGQGTGGQGTTPQNQSADSIASALDSPASSSTRPLPTPSTAPTSSKPMDPVRRVIADHMVLSKKVSPHVTNVVEVDVTKLVRWRDRNKDAFFRKEGVKLTYMPMITDAVARALEAYPEVNASVDGYNIILKKSINIGIAVSLDDGNLVVPVIRDANRLNLGGLAVAIDSLAAKARSNKLTPQDIEGGTFTITNFGTFKSLFGTPIINQPQVAILGVGYIEKKPSVVETPEGDVIAIRHKMYLSLSYDHRIVDGSLGGNFLRAIADNLEGGGKE